MNDPINHKGNPVHSVSASGQTDLTKGSLTKTLIKFAIPFLLANLLQALYSAADLLIVGKFGGGRVGVSAIASGGEIMHLLSGFIIGLTTGAAVLIGKFFGAGDMRNVNRSIGMTLSFSALLGVVSTIILLPLTPFLIRLLNTPPEAVEATKLYIGISYAGIIFIMEYNALSAVFRGFGNSAAPLIFVGIACGINVAGDLLLVAVFGMGVGGAAIATIVSQALSMLFAVIYLYKGDFGFKFRRENFRIAWGLVADYLRIGLPIAMQSILISLSFIFIFSIVNRMGVAASAGYGIVNRVNGFCMLPAVSFGMAMSAITAQNMGASKPARAIRNLWVAIACTMLFGVCCLLLLQFFPVPVVGLFIDRSGEGADEVIRQGVLYSRSFSWEYILVPIVFCTNGFFNGCGRSFFSMVNNLACTFLVRVPVSCFFSLITGATLYEVGFAAPLASFSSNIIALIYLFSGHWKKKRSPEDFKVREK